MAKRDKGTFAFAANYEPTLQAPLDAREVVAAKADLTNVETWSKNGDNVYIYPGMTVKVLAEKKIYMFIGISATVAEVTNPSNWKDMTASGGGGGEVAAPVEFYGIVKNVKTESMSSSSSNLTLVYDAGVNMFLAKEGGFIGDAKYYMGAVHQRLAGSSPVLGQIYVFGKRTFVGVSNGLCELFKTDVYGDFAVIGGGGADENDFK